MKRTPDSEKKHLILFTEKTQALDDRTKRNLLLFLAGAKPNTFIRLRIGKNLHDKHEFERLLKLNKIKYTISRPHGFEEITSVKGNTITWRFAGTWYGYNLFGSAGDQKLFATSTKLAKNGNHEEADLLLGRLYGYPICCVDEFVKEHDTAFLKKKYTSRSFYKRLHDTDIKLPYISFVPGSIHCPEAVKLNKLYETAIKKISPSFYSAYKKKRTHRVLLVVDTEQHFIETHPHDAHEYLLVTTKPIAKHHYVLSWLSDRHYDRGTVIDATVTIQYDAPVVKAHKVLRTLKGLHHERKFPLP